MTPAGHLLSGYLVGRGMAPGDKRILAAALIGSIAPDLDVPLGLLGGWIGASAHRGVTHSFLGGAVLAGLIALLLRGPRRCLFLASCAGILTHIFWDWLNPWGVRPFWPWMESFRGNLLHEGDLVAAGIVAGAAALAWRSKLRAALVVLAIALSGYLTLQGEWRRHARELASVELAGRRTLVYPTNDLRCGWIALSAGPVDMRADCISSPRAARLRPALQVPLRDDSFIQASARSETVRNFRNKVPFPFAEVRPSASGGATVIWRDLRVAYQEQSASEPHGLYVELDATGRIRSEHHRWWLTLW